MCRIWQRSLAKQYRGYRGQHSVSHKPPADNQSALLSSSNSSSGPLPTCSEGNCAEAEARSGGSVWMHLSLVSYTRA